MIITRTLTSSSKPRLIKLLSLPFLSQALTTPIPLTNPPFRQSNNTSPPIHFTHQFSSKPQSPSLPLTRDGNFDDATPQSTVCPGCGIHMQNSNPKHPGFFNKPSIKDPNYKLGNHLVPVMFETEASGSIKKGMLFDGVSDENDSDLVKSTGHERPIVCTRCHSLRHYGKVKDPTVENLFPEFDFYHTVGRRLVSASGARSVVLLVVDAVDFDGSFPKKIAKMVSEGIEENYEVWKEGKSGNVARLVIVVTKLDLLPSESSPTRFEHWVRQRAREGGASMVKRVHFVSAVRDWGLKDLVEDVVELAGPRGNVWAVGTQNAGKSTLLNAIWKCVHGSDGKGSHLTEASVPGTTLGIVRMEGVLPGNAKLFDTPGLLNPRQITTRLTREEQKLVYINKELKPRTYRIKEGHSVHIGGLIRLDVEGLSVDSLYVTVWASPYLPLHMGKTVNAGSMFEEHFGRQLQPPIGEKRVQELGKWVRHEFKVSGSSWDSSSVDIVVAGLGWFAIGLKGEATLGAWTYEGVDVVPRNSLIPCKSQNFEVAGFTVSKIVAKADEAVNKSKRQSEKKRKHDDQKVAAKTMNA